MKGNARTPGTNRSASSGELEDPPQSQPPMKMRRSLNRSPLSVETTGASTFKPIAPVGDSPTNILSAEITQDSFSIMLPPPSAGDTPGSTPFSRFSGSSTSSTFSTTPSLSSSPSERGLKSRPTSKDLLSPVARLRVQSPPALPFTVTTSTSGVRPPSAPSGGGAYHSKWHCSHTEQKLPAPHHQIEMRNMIRKLQK